MKKIVLYSLIMFASLSVKAQNNTPFIYYKSLTDSIINTFNVDTNHLSIKRTDPMIKYKNYFNFVLCFYKGLEYKKIRIRSEKSDHVADVKPKAIDVIASPDDRVYTIIFSNKAHSLIDTVTFEKLSVDGKVALIAEQISLIKEYSNLGFFEVIGMRFKKYSVKRGKELHKDVNLYSIEAGLGYQMMTYTSEVLDKLFEDNWTDKRAYKKYYLKNTSHLLDNAATNAYMRDYPVYLHNVYK